MIGGLVGSGWAQKLWFIPGWKNDHSFFVAEPQATVSVNVASWFRLGFGGGYRFAAQSDRHHANLSGPTANIVLSFGKF